MDTPGGQGNAEGGLPSSAQPSSVGPPSSQTDQAGVVPQEAGKVIEAPSGSQPQAGQPTAAKEKEPSTGVSPTETHPIVEIGPPKELPPDVEGWLERVEKDEVAEPPVIVHKGKPIVSPAAPQAVSVTLPLDDTGIKKGLHYKLFDSIRWLAEWCIRMAKKYAVEKK